MYDFIPPKRYGVSTFVVEKILQFKNHLLTMKGLTKLLGLSVLLAAGCGSPSADKGNFIEENVANAAQQLTLQTDLIEQSGRILNPRTTKADGSIQYIPSTTWTSGFFPGTMWYIYRLTDDPKWLPLAKKYTEALDSVQYLTWHHDVGFMIGCSYLNGYRLDSLPAYKDVIVQAARSLATRYRPGARTIQSWNVDRGWQAERGWKCR